MTELEGIPKHVVIGMDYGLIREGYDLADYLSDAVEDPSGCETTLIHGQQGAGKSNFALQKAYEIIERRMTREKMRKPDPDEVWEAVFERLVFTPADFVNRLEGIDSDRLDVIIWDDIQLNYTNSTFKTDITQYAAIDSMFAVVRTKVAVILITIPNITRLPKNVKDNITFEVFIGKNRKVQTRKIFRLPGTRRVDSNVFKPQLEQPYIFNIYDIPPHIWARYEKLRREIANKALALLKSVTDMEEEENYISVMDASKTLGMSPNTLQQMVSRGVIHGQKIKGILHIHHDTLKAIKETSAPPKVTKWSKLKPD